MASVRSKILYIVPSYGATAWYRCNVPGQELAKRGHTVHLDVAADPSIAHEYDVIVLANGGLDPVLRMLQQARSVGKLVVADIDDDPWHMTDWNPNAGRWDDAERLIVESVLSQADRVTTTNGFLADFLRRCRFNPETNILPNCLPGDRWDVEKEQHQKIVIGWIGGHTHYHDLLMVAEPVNKLLRSRKDIELHLTVFEEHPFEPRSKVKLLPITQDLTRYPKLFSGIDIGIAPLVNDHFNRSKSDLKFLEYGAARVPCVASDIVTYYGIARHGENGLLAKTADDWVECLTMLIEDEALRRRIGEAARKTAESRFIDRNIELWEKAYNLV